VGTDACVLIEAVRRAVDQEDHPCPFLFKLAISHAFRLLLVEQAELEARKALAPQPSKGQQDLRPVLDALLDRCLVERYPNPSLEEVAAAYPILCARMKHGNDVPLAVAVMKAQPDLFISANIRHWKPSLRDVLGGVPIMAPRAALEYLGVPAPPKRPPIPP